MLETAALNFAHDGRKGSPVKSAEWQLQARKQREDILKKLDLESCAEDYRYLIDNGSVFLDNMRNIEQRSLSLREIMILVMRRCILWFLNVGRPLNECERFQYETRDGFTVMFALNFQENILAILPVHGGKREVELKYILEGYRREFLAKL